MKQIVDELNLHMILSPTQSIIFKDILPEQKSKVETILARNGILPISEVNPLVRLSMACPALPLCGLAVAEAERRKGNTGEQLIQLLESRLDNVVYRMGFGSTRAEARQLVTHRAIELNGHKADIPSMLIKSGDVIAIREKSKTQARIRESMDLASGNGIPQWCDVDTAKLVGTFKQAPDRADVARDINESMVVELYSR
jgi:small subunit ribosomal protein S4